MLGFRELAVDLPFPLGTNGKPGGHTWISGSQVSNICQ